MFWTSDLANVVQDADMPAVRRLFQLYEAATYCLEQWADSPLVYGSTHQLVLNPLGKMLTTLLGQINALEDRFGVTPQARMRLGITFAEEGKAAHSLEALNREFSSAEDDETDPR